MRAVLQSKVVARAWRDELVREGYIWATIVPYKGGWAVYSGHVRLSVH